VFLLPWVALTAWTSMPYIRASWVLNEESAQTGGMPGLYLLKTVILVFCVLLGLQGLAMAGRSVLTLTGHDAVRQGGGDAS
jgi:TRAP-type mannitol/chloroaromatic compound transport system permease small subunit